MRAKFWLAAFLSFIVITTPVWADTYKVDPGHTAVSFKVRHLVSNTQGVFKDFQGTIDYDPANPSSWKAQGSIQVASVDTRQADRDKHLLSKDFFDVEAFPVIEFVTTKVLSSDSESAKIEGLLTLHGVQKTIVLDVQFLGIGQDPWGNTRAGFTATTKINRKDFGVSYNKVLDKGYLLLGDEVSITLEIEAIKA